MCNIRIFVCYGCEKEERFSLEKDCRQKECSRMYQVREKTVCGACTYKMNPEILEAKFWATPRIRYATVDIKRGHRNF
jgi:hypothetical protein